MKIPLTKAQQAVYDLVKGYADEHDGDTPTHVWLRDKLGVRSINSVVQVLKTLERKGYIFRRRHVKHNHIMLADGKLDGVGAQTILVPIVGSSACGDLSASLHEIADESIEIDQGILDDLLGPFVAVRAAGWSMGDADIEDGDYVLVQVTKDVKNGDKVIAVVDGRAVVRVLDKKDGLTLLRPVAKDPSLKPIVLRSDFEPEGRVICVIPGETLDITNVVYD